MSSMVKGQRRVIAFVVAVTLAMTVVAAAPAHADDLERARGDAGLGVVTVLANVFYMPVKLGYALIGGLTGALGYAFTGGNSHVAQRIWVSSLGGDYVLSRDMVTGEQKIQFSGSTDPDL